MSDDNVIKLGSRGKARGKSGGKTRGESKGKCEEKSGDKFSAKFESEYEGSNQNEQVCCSFCGRSDDEVLKMVKGPGVNICSECTMIAVQYLILQDKMLSSDAQKILDAFWHKD